MPATQTETKPARTPPPPPPTRVGTGTIGRPELGRPKGVSQMNVNISGPELYKLICLTVITVFVVLIALDMKVL